jgi:hypothetical protein
MSRPILICKNENLLLHIYNIIKLTVIIFKLIMKKTQPVVQQPKKSGFNPKSF